MTNETRQRIEHYTSLLPGMKEKVMAATMMFVMALVVMVTATYAWITLSTAPEVTSVDTTVAANGSLEIALANGTGSAPGKSAEGDSTGAGNPVNAANITWGNIVNLSDPSYGLSRITLRPAALNGTSGLLTNPLYGVGYGEDGRISTMITDDDFAYTYFDTNSSKFVADLDDTHLGVRAISSVKYENLQGDSTLSELLRYTNENLSLAKVNYASMTNEGQEPGTSYIKSLEGLIQIYAQNVIDRKSTSSLDVTNYVPDLYNMLQYFNDNVVLPAGDSYLYMSDMLELMKGSGAATSGYSLETLVEGSIAGTLPDYIGNNISSLNSYAKDYTKLQEMLATSEKGDYSDFSTSQKNASLAYWAYYAQNGGKVYWSNLNSIINWICEINTATLDGYTMSGLSNMTTASKILTGDNPHDAVISGGALYRMEKRIGQKMSPTISVTVDASSMNIPFVSEVSMDAILTTSAIDPYDMPTDREIIKGMNTGSFRGDTATAEDTYAMAIDLWVRSNAGSNETESTTTSETETNNNGELVITTVITSPEKAFLTLEGAVVTEIQQVEATMLDASGEERYVYVASFSVNGTEASMDVFERYGNYYYLDENKQEHEFNNWLAQNVGENIEVEYTQKMDSKEVIVGYEGENRVWNDEQMIEYSGTGTSTTQGRGSCYIFYAETPADQKRFLELLGSMKVVFVNAQGRQIGSAYMDTENIYALNGQVTVPLVLDKSHAINLGSDLDGNTIYGLMALDKNVATRITALVYLDGTGLTNEMVLASGDIQGNLNIQFGTSSAYMTTTTIAMGDTTESTVSYSQGTDSVAIKNDALMDDFIDIVAEAEQTEFTYNPEQPASTKLDITISGVEPNTVSARFIRAISSTQGVQQDMITIDGSGASWSTTCSFDKPGNYVLRTVWVDGIEYTLDDPVTIIVEGSSVNSLTCEAIPANSRKATIMTADSTYSTGMTLGFTSSEQVLESVKGIFMDENGVQVNVPFTFEDETWKGTATFTSSGTFSMEYVEIDGEIYELAESLQPTLEVMLGLKARTWISASDETLAKLQAINENAVATSFVLDTSATDEEGNPLLDIANKKDVSLEVAVEIYDNNGNEIIGLADTVLYYGRAGSNVASRGLDSNLTWNSKSGRYEGDFLVTEAGTFKFSQVAIGTSNHITSYTSAPNIQVMPPEDAYYFNNYTDTYQYKPNLDAAMTIGVAYSSAASKIEATITNSAGTISKTVEGTMGAEAEDQGEDSVNLWNFKIPSDDNTSQDGEWKLTSITMYGVYYNGEYYDEDTGVTINLSDKNIYTKVVNYLHVTLSGTSQEFTGTFMEDHNVTDMTVTIADYEGEPVQGASISDVKVVYMLNKAAVTQELYGYTSDILASTASDVLVDGVGNPINDTNTQFDISGLNFQIAGPYNTCKISFAINGVTADMSKTILRYYDGGQLSSIYPVFDVKWSSPTLTVEGTDPSPNETFKVKTNGDSDVTAGAVYLNGVRNYYSDYYANVYINSEGLLDTFVVPKVSLSLSDAGDKFDTATIYVPNNESSDYDVTYSFTENNTIEKEIGGIETIIVVQNRILAGKHTFKEIDMVYGEHTYSVTLSNPITIRNEGFAPPYLKYEGGDVTNNSNPETEISLDGKSIKVTLPKMNTWTEEKIVSTSLGEPTVTTTTSDVCEKYTKNFIFTRYRYYTRTVTRTTESAQKDTYIVTYGITGWNINGKTYVPGTEITIGSGTTATAVIGELSRVLQSSEVSTHITEYTLDSFVSEDNRNNGGRTQVSPIYETSTLTKEEWK